MKFLTCLIVCLISKLSYSGCPNSKRLKPCVCDERPINYVGSVNKTILKISCFRAESWNYLRHALKPLRNRPDLLVDSLQVFGIGDRSFPRIKRLFRRIHVMKLSIVNSEFASNRTKRRLPKSMFRNASVHSLEIQYSNLDRVPSTALKQLPMLSELNLAHNSIRIIKRKAFRFSKNLKFLDLRDNSLISIPTKALKGLPNLEVLILNTNAISTVKEKSLMSLKNLKLLDLGVNSIVTIHQGAFLNLHNLEQLHLTYNLFLDVARALDNLKLVANNLHLVEISGSIIPLDSFTGYNLSTISLRDKPQLNLDTLSNFGNLLQRLDLSENFQLTNESFSSDRIMFPTIEEIDISMTMLPIGVLRHFPSVKSIFMEHCALRRLRSKQFFAHRNKLETLVLNSCRISKINPFAFRGLEKSLKHLSINWNFLSNISNITFSRLKNLETVDLSFNKIADSFMKHYPLNSNFFPAAGSSLRSLNLKGNALISVPARLLRPLKELRYLNLDRNGIINLDFELKRNTKLEVLSLNNNRIGRIHPHAFSRLENLRELYLSNNELYNSPTPFASLLFPPNLEVLNLNANYLQYIRNPFLSYLTKLQSVHLSHNKLRFLRRDLFKNANRTLVYLDLSANELDCSCRLRPFVDWLSRHRVTLNRRTECAYPKSFRGQSLITRICWSQCGTGEESAAFRFCAPGTGNNNSVGGF